MKYEEVLTWNVLYLSRSSTKKASSKKQDSHDEPDKGHAKGHHEGLHTLMERLSSDVGSMALFSGQELELLAEFEPEELASKYDLAFLQQIQEAAARHLSEKQEIRDALGLLKIYNKASTSSPGAKSSSSSSSKRRKSKKWEFFNDLLIMDQFSKNVIIPSTTCFCCCPLCMIFSWCSRLTRVGFYTNQPFLAILWLWAILLYYTDPIITATTMYYCVYKSMREQIACATLDRFGLFWLRMKKKHVGHL